MLLAARRRMMILGEDLRGQNEQKLKGKPGGKT